MSGSFTQNQFNTLILPIQCSVSVASYRDIAVRVTGALRLDTLHAVRIKHAWIKWTSFIITFSVYSYCYSALTLQRPQSFSLVMFVKTDCVVWGFFPLQLKFKILELIASASVELPSSSPMFLHEERPVRHVSQ